MSFLKDLSSRRRFGMKPGLETIGSICAELGDPQRDFVAVHVAGTNGKGAVSAMLDSALRGAGMRVGRYTSPHLVKINERFFLDGAPISDDALERAATRVTAAANADIARDLTFFEALTAVAFVVYSRANVDFAILECGLGGRLDATNVCNPRISVITRIGLDHCDWLGDSVEKIAAEKAGIIKPGVPVVLGRNDDAVRGVVEARAVELDAPFHYAPDLADESEIPRDFALKGAFNRENAVTAIAALKVLKMPVTGFGEVVWPGRFQRIDRFLVDGAHNPPAAKALADALKVEGVGEKSLDLVAGFCGDKDVEQVLTTLSPFVRRGFAVRTNNPRSLTAAETAAKMRSAGMDAAECVSLKEAIAVTTGETLVCGSLFLAGEALVELGAYPWPSPRFDSSEILKNQ